MNVLDLFSGAAGGWSLGLHRAGRYLRPRTYPETHPPMPERAAAWIRAHLAGCGEAEPESLDAERYRWFRDQCSQGRKIEIAEYADHPDMLDHHIDKGMCGL